MSKIKKIAQSKIFKVLFWIAFWAGNLFVAGPHIIPSKIPGAQIASGAIKLFYVLMTLVFVLNVLFLGCSIFYKERFKKTAHYLIALFVSICVTSYLAYVLWNIFIYEL